MSLITTFINWLIASLEYWCAGLHLFGPMFSTYVFAKFWGEMGGLRVVANRDNDGRVYGGAHYDHGVDFGVFAVTVLSIPIQFFIMAKISLDILKSNIPIIVVYVIFLGLLLRQAFKWSKENEAKLQSMSEKEKNLGYKYYK